MADNRPYLSHAERTAASSRDPSIHPVTISSIAEDPPIRHLRLAIDPQEAQREGHIKFLPGQWVDLHIPGMLKPGGFTITSPPAAAAPPKRKPDDQNAPPISNPTHKPYIELAVQKSPGNPAAAWLWQTSRHIQGQKLHVRVGGDFVWPPLNGRIAFDAARDPVVFVAGGVGVNPFMSMVTNFARTNTFPRHATLLYGSKCGACEDLSDILFVRRLLDLHPLQLRMFLTGRPPRDLNLDVGLGWRKEVRNRRMTVDDVRSAALEGRDVADGDTQDGDVLSRAVVYVCGPQTMTDSFVEGIKAVEGVKSDRVLCEKWW